MYPIRFPSASRQLDLTLPSQARGPAHPDHDQPENVPIDVYGAGNPDGRGVLERPRIQPADPGGGPLFAIAAPPGVFHAHVLLRQSRRRLQDVPLELHHVVGGGIPLLGEVLGPRMPEAGRVAEDLHRVGRGRVLGPDEDVEIDFGPRHGVCQRECSQDEELGDADDQRRGVDAGDLLFQLPHGMDASQSGWGRRVGEGRHLGESGRGGESGGRYVLSRRRQALGVF